VGSPPPAYGIVKESASGSNLFVGMSFLYTLSLRVRVLCIKIKVYFMSLVRDSPSMCTPKGRAASVKAPYINYGYPPRGLTLHYIKPLHCRRGQALRSFLIYVKPSPKRSLGALRVPAIKCKGPIGKSLPMVQRSLPPPPPQVCMSLCPNLCKKAPYCPEAHNLCKEGLECMG
jgi:hypothetical protein